MQTIVNWWIQFFRRVFDEELENINLKKKLWKKLWEKKRNGKINGPTYCHIFIRLGICAHVRAFDLPIGMEIVI